MNSNFQISIGYDEDSKNYYWQIVDKEHNVIHEGLEEEALDAFAVALDIFLDEDI